MEKMEVSGLANDRGSMSGFAIVGYILCIASGLLLIPSWRLIENTFWLGGLAIANLAGLVLMFIFFNSFSKACKSLNDDTANEFYMFAFCFLVAGIFGILYFILWQFPVFLFMGLIPSLTGIMYFVKVGRRLKKRHTGLIQTVGQRIMSVFKVFIVAIAVISIFTFLMVLLVYHSLNPDYLILVYLVAIIFSVWQIVLMIKLFLSMDEFMTNGYYGIELAEQTSPSVFYHTMSAASFEEVSSEKMGNYAIVPTTEEYNPSTNSNQNLWRYLMMGCIGLATGILIWFSIKKFSSANTEGNMVNGEVTYTADPTDEYLRSICVLTDERIRDVILNNKCTSSYNIVERLFKSANELQLGGRNFTISKRNPMKSFIVETEEDNMALVSVYYTDKNSSREEQYNVILKKQKITTDGKTEYVWDIENFENHPEVMRSRTERADYVNTVYRQIMSAGGPAAYWDSYYGYGNHGYAREEYIEKAEKFIGRLKKSFPSGVVH